MRVPWYRPYPPADNLSQTVKRMDARLQTATVCLAATFLFADSAISATAKSPNFVVTAESQEIADKVARCAEVWREDLAIQWLGKTLPNWYQPCPISVKTGQIGAGGSTTFTFDRGEVFGWKMQVQGTLERILDSVIPHEVNHTIFASYFRRPLPRWADEGAATLFEHRSEKARQEQTINSVIRTNRRIPLEKLLTMAEYPTDMQDVLTLYAEGFFLARFLVERKGETGHQTYLRFLEDAHQNGWSKAFKKHYGFTDLSLVERQWTDWVVAGAHDLTPRTPEDGLLANNDEVDIRFQSPGTPPPLAMIPRQLRRVASAPNNGIAPNNDPRQPSTQAAVPPRFRPEAPAPLSNPTNPIATSNASRSGAPIGRDGLSPTTLRIMSDPNAPSYRFPQRKPF